MSDTVPDVDWRGREHTVVGDLVDGDRHLLLGGQRGRSWPRWKGRDVLGRRAIVITPDGELYPAPNLTL